MNLKMRKYDIYLCRVYFINRDTGERESKVRPVVIIDENTAIPLAHPITSHTPRNYYNGDYEIQNWQEAGLDVPSTLRLNYIVDDRNRGQFGRRIGRLTEEDINNIEEIYPNIFPKDLI